MSRGMPSTGWRSAGGYRWKRCWPSPAARRPAPSSTGSCYQAFLFETRPVWSPRTGSRRRCIWIPPRPEAEERLASDWETVMKLSNRLAANTSSYAPYSLEEALAGIAASGFRHVELAAIRGIIEHVPLTPDTRTLGRVHRLLNHYSLTPVALSAHSNLTTARGLKDAFRALDLCERMGIPILNTAVGGPEEGEEDEAAFLRNIGGLADYATERDIIITLEIHGELTATGQKSAELVEKVNRPNVRVNYDTANCEYFGAVRAENDLPDVLPWVALCHLKDKVGGRRVWNFPALGRGHVDFAKVLRTLRRGGYAGPYSVEVEFKGHPWPSLATVNRAMGQSYRYLTRLGLS